MQVLILEHVQRQPLLFELVFVVDGLLGLDQPEFKHGPSAVRELLLLYLVAEYLVGAHVVVLDLTGVEQLVYLGLELRVPPGSVEDTHALPNLLPVVLGHTDIFLRDLQLPRALCLLLLQHDGGVLLYFLLVASDDVFLVLLVHLQRD